MAATIGRAIGKHVRSEEICDQQAYAGVVRWAGKGPYADALIDIWRAADTGFYDLVGVGRIRPVVFRRRVPTRLSAPLTLMPIPSAEARSRAGAVHAP